jgi:inorganic pyrophosphatase
MDVIIEIPNQTLTKYEVDKEYNLLRMDRMLQTSMVYPGNYGYIPKTLGGDGDPLDIIMPVDYPIHPMSLVKVKPVGVIIMEDEAGMDEKVIVYPDNKVDSRYQKINSLSDVPKETLDKIVHFFQHYKDLSPGKFVKIKSIKGKAEALKIIKESEVAYQNSQLSKINELKDLATMGKTKPNSKSKKVMTGGNKKNKKSNKNSRKVRRNRK